jgi:endothelin-converting enzyme
VYRHGLLSRSSYRDQTLVDRYSLVIKEVLTQVLATARFNTSVLGDHLLHDPLDQKGRSLDELIQALIALEAQLFDAIPPLGEWFDVTKYYNIYSLQDANSLIPQISLRSLIANQTGNLLPQMVVMTSLSYIRTLSEALHAADETTVQAYLIWRAVQAHAVNIDHESMRHFLEFQNSLQGKEPKASQERWKVCVRHVDKGLGKQFLRFER